MQSIDIGPNARECLLQLFVHGPTWDGDIVSKAGRGELFDRGYATRCNGWSSLTEAGLHLAVRAGFGDEKERRDNRKRRESNDRHRALVYAARSFGGAFVVPPTDDSGDLDVTCDKDGNVKVSA